jgi:hypothetical protein
VAKDELEHPRCSVKFNLGVLIRHRNGFTDCLEDYGVEDAAWLIRGGDSLKLSAVRDIGGNKWNLLIAILAKVFKT